MGITIVAAMGRNRVIGAGNRLPWRLPADLRRFKALTLGKAVIMGRRTHESIGRPLPGRRNIVLSARPGYAAPGCDVARSLDEALALVPPGEEAVVIGGAQVFAEALPLCERVHLTIIDEDFAGDALFPELPPGRFEARVEGVFEKTAEDPHPHRFLTLTARGPRGPIRG